MITLEDAIALAAHLHKDQVDKQGEPYILHPLRVMLLVPDYLRVLAILHDVLEDCDMTKAGLVSAVQDDWTIERLDLLTHRDGEARSLYIGRVCTAPEAVIVKCADLSDNISRTTGLDEQTIVRLHRKYVRDFDQIADWYMKTFLTDDQTVGLMDAVFNAIASTSRRVRSYVTA